MLSSLLELIAERRQLTFFKGLIKAEIEVHSFQSELVGDHELHIEPGICDAFVFEKGRSFLKNIEDRRHVRRV